MTRTRRATAAQEAPQPVLPAIPPDTVLRRLAALQTVPTAELKDQWRTLFRVEPPPWNRAYQRMLDDGRYASVSEMAAAEKIERGHLGTLLRLTLLAPELVEDIVDGRQPLGLGLPQLLAGVAQDWSDQRESCRGE